MLVIQASTDVHLPVKRRDLNQDCSLEITEVIGQLKEPPLVSNVSLSAGEHQCNFSIDRSLY